MELKDMSADNAYMGSRKVPKRSRKPLFLTLFLVLLAGAGAGGVWHVQKQIEAEVAAAIAQAGGSAQSISFSFFDKNLKLKDVRLTPEGGDLRSITAEYAELDGFDASCLRKAKRGALPARVMNYFKAEGIQIDGGYGEDLSFHEKLQSVQAEKLKANVGTLLDIYSHERFSPAFFDEVKNCELERAVFKNAETVYQAEGESVRVTVEESRILNWVRDIFDIETQNASVEMKEESMRCESAAFSGFAIPESGFLAALIPGSRASGQVESYVKKALNGGESLSDLLRLYETVFGDRPVWQKLEVRNCELRVKEVPDIRIARIFNEQERERDTHFYGFSVDDVSVAKDGIKKAAGVEYAEKIEKWLPGGLHASWSGRTGYAPSTGDYTAKTHFSMPNIGACDTSYEVVLPAQELVRLLDEEKWDSVFNKTSLKKLSLKWDDKGLIRLLLELYAEENGKSLESTVRELRDGLTQAIEMGQALLLSQADKDFVNQLGDAARVMLEQPGTVEAMFEAEKPVPLSAFGKKLRLIPQDCSASVAVTSGNVKLLKEADGE
ncbi:MAG: hypothetical protein J5855_07635 [Mailhella sp.]|nr:hypothetical protein [Mailhella sp.]